MRKLNLFLISICLFGLTFQLSAATKSDETEIKFTQGPAAANLGGVAQINVPAGFIFIDGETMREMMEATGQPASGDEVGMLEPTNGNWAVMFRFNDVGYVKDEDKDKLDATKLLKEISDGTEEANKHRKRSGIAPIHVVGWEMEPRYNETTHNLEWAVRGNSEGEDILNYDTRLLGRKGFMSVKLIVEPKEFAVTMPAFTNLLSTFKFNSGESYAEFKPGDKVAKYGLAALVVGGAAVGAAKLGLLGPVILFFKKAWKLVIVAVVAIAVTAKNLIAKLFGRNKQE